MINTTAKLQTTKQQQFKQIFKYVNMCDLTHCRNLQNFKITCTQ